MEESLLTPFIQNTEGIYRPKLGAAFAKSSISDVLDEQVRQAINSNSVLFACELPDDGRKVHFTGFMRLHEMGRYAGVKLKPEIVQHILDFMTRQRGAFTSEATDASWGSSWLFIGLNSWQGHGFDEIAVALHHLIREEVVVYRIRDTLDSMSFWLAENYTYTVFAVDWKESKRYCFHVRAGTPEVAVRKLRDAPEYHNVQLLAILPGRIEPVAEPLFYLNHGHTGQQPKEEDLLRTVRL